MFRADSSTMSRPDDPHLRFGLLLTPRWITAPITDQVTQRPLAELSTDDAATVLEGLCILQTLRSGVVGAVLLAIGILSRDASVTDSGWVRRVYFLVMLWLPAYAVFLSMAWLRLRRAKRRAEPVAAHQRVLALVRWSPVLGFLASGVGALVLA